MCPPCYAVSCSAQHAGSIHRILGIRKGKVFLSAKLGKHCTTGLITATGLYICGCMCATAFPLRLIGVLSLCIVKSLCCTRRPSIPTARCLPVNVAPGSLIPIVQSKHMQLPRMGAVVLMFSKYSTCFVCPPRLRMEWGEGWG